MKIVHINTMDVNGGAAIAACRHVEAMLHNHIDAHLLVRSKRSTKGYVRKLALGIRLPLKPLYKILHQKRLRSMHPVGNFSIMKYGHSFYKDRHVCNADVIFLHWISFNCLSIKGVKKILELGKPTFWFMHDMFPFTGGCHYSLDCKEYIKSCTNCPLVEGMSSKEFIQQQHLQKMNLWQEYPNLTFVAPSKWLLSCAKESALAKHNNIVLMPNFINTDIFKPLKDVRKEQLGLYSSKKTLLIGAADLNSVYKGGRYVYECIKMLDTSQYEILVIGNASEDFIKNLEINIVSTGFLNDEAKLVQAYNSCDVFIISSVAENYPNMVLEAMACGKPCIGVPCGGIPDLIRDGENGYITDSHSAIQLKEKIELLFSDKEQYNMFAKNSRRFVLENNSYDVLPHWLEKNSMVEV